MGKVPREGKIRIALECFFPMFIICLAMFFCPSQADAQEKAVQKIEGAEYVGTETCAACHEEQAKRFSLTSHYRVLGEKKEVLGGGCESCHGAGSKHAESQSKKDIVRYEPENCFSCHMDRKGDFLLQHHHPVVEGRMKCTDCHNPHGTELETMNTVSMQKSDQACFKCHKEMKGPFVFEHDVMREGCQTCHNPHGSVYDKMLVADQANLCLRCHWEPSFNTSTGTIGAIKHGTKAGAGGDYYIGKGQECIDHHRAVHGSNIWKTLNR